MKKLFKYLRINRTFEFPGHVDELMERMKFLSSNHKRFKTTNLGNRTYKVAAKVSLGTLTSGGIGIPIHVQLNIEDQGNSNPVINIKSKIRPEHYFIVLLFGVLLILNLIDGDQSLYFSLFASSIFIIVHFWFHMVYRAQENELIKKIRGQLKLIEKRNQTN